MERTRCTLVVLGAALLVGSRMTTPALSADPETLRLNTPVERRLSGRDTHTYAVSLAAGEGLKLVVEQRGVDVVVRVVSPRGKTLAMFDSPNGDQGPEHVSWIALEPGGYQVVVAPLEPSSQEGRYEIRLSEVRRASAQERKQARAEHELRELAEAWQKARVSYDLDALRRFAADDYVQASPGNELVREDKAQMLQRLEEARKRRPVGQSATEEIPHIVVRVYGDTAWVTGRMLTTLSREGHEVRSTSYFTQLWRRGRDGWRLAADQFAFAGPLPREHKAIQLSKEIQDAYAGRYTGRLGSVITVQNAGDHLVMQPNLGPDSPRYQLYPESETDFFARDVDLEVTFVRDTAGRVTQAIQIWGGRITNRLTRLP